MYMERQSDPSWFVQKLTIEDTRHISDEALQSERREMPDNRFRQEYYTDFEAAVDDALFNAALIRAATKRDVLPGAYRPIWGLDVAGGQADGDRTALAKRKANVLTEKIQSWNGLDLMQTAGKVFRQILESDDRPSHVVVDAIGLGAGVAARLKELVAEAGLADQVAIVALNVGESAAESDRFERLRDELWWAGKTWFDNLDVSMPVDDELAAELTAATYTQTSTGKIKAEAKKDMRKRLGVSPDLADAFLLTFAVQPKHDGWRRMSGPSSRPIVNLGHQRAKR